MASSDDDSYEMIAESTGVDIFSFGGGSPFSETSDGSWTNVVPSAQRSQSSLVASGAVRSTDHHQEAQLHSSSDDEESVDTQEFEKIKEDMISMFNTATIECHFPPKTLWDPSAINTGTGDQVADASKQEATSGYAVAPVYNSRTTLPSPKGLGHAGFATEQPRVAVTPLDKKAALTLDRGYDIVDQLLNGFRDSHLQKEEQDTGEEIEEKSAPPTVLQHEPAVDTTENYLPNETTNCIPVSTSRGVWVSPNPSSRDEASGDHGPISRVWGSPSRSALSSVFDPPHHILHKDGGFEGALLYARESHRLLLVNLQQYPGFGCYAINRDIWRNELIQTLIEARFVFWQSTTNSRDAAAYAQQFRVSLFPHVAVLNPNHRSHIWGIEGWTAENPWTVIDIAEKLAEISFDQFTEEQLSMEVVDEDEEPFIAEPMIDVSSEMELQASILGEHDLLSAVNIFEFYELQQVMLLTAKEDRHMDTGP